MVPAHFTQSRPATSQRNLLAAKQMQTRGTEKLAPMNPSLDFLYLQKTTRPDT
jgi:hypothetical protein